jgi:glycosyltransferase involved in cell wall biosynthesis
MNPLVSVVIPSYNSARWLDATIASVRAQTWSPCEIILVDDGSTDGSGELGERLAGAGMRVVRQANAGQCAALNRGLREAKGEFIQYLDADDLIAPDKIAVQMARLRGLPPTWIASGAWARFTDDPAEASFEPEAVWRDLAPIDWLIASWSGGGMMHGAAWLIPRGIVEKAGPWNESLSLINDLDYFSRLLLSSEGIAFCPAALTFYRSSVAGSLSRQTSRAAWESAFLATRLSTDAIIAREDSPRVRRACAINYQRLVHSAYPFVPDLVAAGERRTAELGGCDLSPGGGAVFKGLNSIFGWKIARRAQILGRRLLKGASP